MTCRHAPGDPNCSSSGENVRRRLEEEHRKQIEALKAQLPETPDAMRYEIVQAERVGPHLVLKVKYPNCAKCAYEGVKVLVMLNASEVDALRWKVIDPHFRDPKAGGKVNWAPGPSARFPASADGWADAIAYAHSKVPATDGTRKGCVP